jgi:hypothetical protein
MELFWHNGSSFKGQGETSQARSKRGLEGMGVKWANSGRTPQARAMAMVRSTSAGS